jgi:CheY-like chemotaxis protein
MAFGRTGQGLRQPYRPRALVQEAWTLAVQDVPEGVDARIDIDADDLELVGDGVAFFEAALNLMRNAVQAVGERGTLHARLFTETVEQPRVLWQGNLRPGHWLGLLVEDDGPGIEPAHLPRLLEPFYSTRGAQGGTGLGLAVVHAAVRDAHGAIELRTAPGEGTAITLHLPLPEPAHPVAGGEAGAWSGQGEVVMVVDDEPALVALLEEHLAERGFEPRGFSDAERAWHAFEAEPALFAAVLSDQAMPRLSGLELIERCRRLSPGVVALIATAYGGTDFGARASAAGVQAVLSKPLNWAELDAVLQRLLHAPR